MDEAILTVIIAGALLLFITEWLRVDVVALLIMGALIVTGILTPAQAVEGFSNVATLTVLFMFIISAALLKTGVLGRVGVYFSKMLKARYKLGLLVMMISLAAVSAFTNNTPVVAMFIPIVVRTANEANIPATKLLIPLSFASIFGGLCTLIGTSTNILVDGIAKESGLAGFEMFTLAPAGLCMLVAGILYMNLLGDKLLPDREANNGSVSQLKDYIAEIVLPKDSSSANKSIKETPLVVEYEMDILGVIRHNAFYSLPSEDYVLQAGDVLKVKYDIEHLQKLKEFHINSRPQLKENKYLPEFKDTSLVELVITSSSPYAKKTIQDVNLWEKYQAILLAIRNRENIIYEKLEHTLLKAGDVILIEIDNEALNELKKEAHRQHQPFLLIKEHRSSSVNWRNFSIVIGCLLAAVLLSAFDVLHIMGGALVASSIIILTGCLPVKEIYEVVNWKVIFLLAGAISLGVAMEETGLSLSVASELISVAESFGPIGILSALYFLTSMMTQMISNASAALVAPIAISVAQQAEVSPLPFLVAVALAASASFMTPIGYQTNTMVYGAGNYKFKDFIKVGTGLNLLFWIVATIVIPLFYEF